MPDKEQKSTFDIQREQIQAKEQDEQIKRLEDQLEKEKDARLEERFLSLLVFVILLDAFLFTLMPSWGGPVAILALEVFLLIPIARRMGHNEMAKLLDKFFLGFIKSRN